MKKQAIVGTVLLFLAALARPAHAQPPIQHSIFRAQGNSAAVFLQGVSVNGIGDAVALDVFQDPQTGDTSLVLHVFAFYAGGNSTEYFLRGSIPSADFAIAPDLSSATLNTTINSSPGGQFDDPDIGPITGLVIDLTWSPIAFGHRNISSNFRSGIPGQISYSETFHQNGKQTFGPIAGSFGPFQIDLPYNGELNENRFLDIVRIFLK